MLGISLMFFVLFRNVLISLIGVVPNFIAAFFILGIIGLNKIPLDMMTITIAAITIGIAVDNSIHYIYRFKEELKILKDYNLSRKMPLNCWGSNTEYIDNYSIRILNFSFIKLYSDYLFWSFHRYGHATRHDFSFNTFTKTYINI